MRTVISRFTALAAWLLCLVLLPTAMAQRSAPGAKVDEPKTVANSIGMKLVLIPAGEFMMGSSETAEELAKAFKDYAAPPADFFVDEHPLHRVRITKPFFLGVHEVTVGQFRQFVKDTGYKRQQSQNDCLEELAVGPSLAKSGIVLPPLSPHVTIPNQ